MIKRKFVFGLVFMALGIYSHEAFSLKKTLPAAKEAYPSTFVVSGSSSYYCPNATASAITAKSTNTICGVGTGTAYVSVTVNWYQNTSASQIGAVLVSTTTGSASVITYKYTPSTSSNGTLYYYATISWSAGAICAPAGSITTDYFSVTVSLPTLSGVSQAAPVCAGTSAAINLTGLRPSATQSVSYNINGGTTVTKSVTSNSSGAGNLLVTLQIANDGKLLTVTNITAGGCSSNFNSNNSTILSVIASPTFSKQPSGTSRNYCLNSAAIALSVTASAGSGTISTYQWYSNTSKTIAGATLVATHVSALTTDTYTPLTTSLGTLYYYCVATNSNGCTKNSSWSGANTVSGNNTSTLTSAAGTDAQNVCINSAITDITYATTGATGANFSGLPSGVTGNWTANVATISGTPTALGNFNYIITLTGGCGLVTSNGTIAVSPNNTSTLSSAVGTDDQSVCFNTAITNITYATTGATGANFSGLPAGVSGIWSANVATISGSPTESGTFNYSVTLTGGCGLVASNGSIIVNPSGYTKWTGDVSTDWSNSGNWTCGLPSSTIDADIPSGLINYPAIGAVTVSARNLTIATGASLQLNSASTLQVSGDLNCNGVFTSGGGTVDFNGASLQNLGASGNSVITFDNINVTNTAAPISVSVESNQNLKGILTLSANSTFDADGSTGASVFTLLSTSDMPTTDASIATLPTGASVIGKVTVQRYMGRSGSSTAYQVYRDISSPVNTTVLDLQSSLPVTGPFTNSSVVTTDGSTVDNTVNYTIPSLEIYNEAATGPKSSGWTGFPASGGNTATASFVAGRGYSLFIYGSDYPVLQNGNAKWSLTGTINSGSISLPVTLTKTGAGGTYNANTDGWNFVGNPYPSTIDWSAATGWTKTNINNAIYIDDFSSGSDVLASYVNGVGTNGGSRYIAMGQGFWVKGNAVSPVLSVDERVKVGGQQTSFFRESSPSNLLRIALSSDQVRDETVIYFTESATSEFDSNLDALKMMNRNQSFNLSSLLANGEERYSINALPLTDCSKKVSLDVSHVASGSYSLNFSDFESLPTSTTISLKDNFENRLVDVRENQKYAFEVNQNNSSTYGHERFSLIFNFGAGTAQKCDASASSGVNVYPNPSKGIVTIEVNGEDLATGQLFNSMGMIINSVGFTNEGQVQKAKHDFSKEGSGVYFLRVMQGGRVNTIRIVRD